MTKFMFSNLLTRSALRGIVHWDRNDFDLKPSTFFSLHVRSADQLPSQLPNDITFEVCSSSSPSSPAAPASSASSSATHGGDDKEDTGSAGTFIKTEKDSGVHFLTNRTEEDQTDLLLPKSEASDNEPEVRKQVGCISNMTLTLMIRTLKIVLLNS